MFDKFDLENMQESKTQFSYSPLDRGLVVKSDPLKDRSVIKGLFLWGY